MAEVKILVARIIFSLKCSLDHRLWAGAPNANPIPLLAHFNHPKPWRSDQISASRFPNPSLMLVWLERGRGSHGDEHGKCAVFLGGERCRCGAWGNSKRRQSGLCALY